jgi:hypothetical protein
MSQAAEPENGANQLRGAHCGRGAGIRHGSVTFECARPTFAASHWITRQVKCWRQERVASGRCITCASDLGSVQPLYPTTYGELSVEFPLPPTGLFPPSSLLTGVIVESSPVPSAGYAL